MLIAPLNCSLNRRIIFFSHIVGIFLKLGGLTLAIVQIIKSFGEGWTTSNIQTLLLGIVLVVLGLKAILVNLVSRIILSRRAKIIKICLFIFPLIFTVLLLYVKWKLGYESQSWQRINSEGGLVEYGTSIAYILTSIFTYQIGKTFWSENDKFLGFIYFFMMGLFLFIGLEEISYGQRLIGFSSPDFFKDNNIQGEVTLHNLSFFHRNLLHQSYILIGFLGSFSWLLFLKKSRNFIKKVKKYLIPPWFIASFFFPVFVFYIIHEYTNGLGFFIYIDQESFEFILSLEFLAFITINFFKQVTGIIIKEEF